jgi:hypothetical protein
MCQDPPTPQTQGRGTRSPNENSSCGTTIFLSIYEWEQGKGGVDGKMKVGGSDMSSEEPRVNTANYPGFLAYKRELAAIMKEEKGSCSHQSGRHH